MINLDKRFYSLIKILERNRNKKKHRHRKREKTQKWAMPQQPVVKRNTNEKESETSIANKKK